MMRWIVESSLKSRLLVVAFAASMMFFGITQLRDAPVDILPEFTPPHVEIQTEALGLSAAEVEQLITVPLEADLLNGVAFLDEIRSESVHGLSSIELVFEPGTDILDARQVVAERLTQAGAIPNVSKPPAMLQPLSSTSRVMMVGLSSKDVSLIELSVLARWKIKPRLLGVPGVANVSVWGQRERQLQVQVDPKRLRDNGVSLVQVMETTGNALWVSPLSFVEASTPGTGGFIDTPNQRLAVQHVSPIVGADDLGQVTVEDTEGKVLRLSDVANVVEDHQPLIGDAVVNGGPSLMLVIEKFPGASTLQVTRDLESALVALHRGLPGVEIDTGVYRPASFIDTALDNLGLALLLGLILVMVLLAAFLVEWRAALISLVAIPLSLVAAWVALYLRGTTLNTMILAGLVIALGSVIDEAVIDVDNMRRRLGQHRHETSGRSTAAVVLDASLEMRRSTIFATLIILVAALPAALLGGLTGEFSRPLVFSYALAVLGAMVVALTVTPALGLMVLSGAPLDRRESPVVRWLQRRYDRVLSWFIRRSRWAYATVAVVVLAGLGALPFLGQRELLPPLQDRQLLIQWDGAPGTSHTEMARVIVQASRELGSLPGVRDVGAHVGRAITSDEVVGVNSSELWVSIDPAADYDAAVASVRDVVEGYPGLSSEVELYPEEKIREVETGVDDDLVVRVYGQDLGVLRVQADEVRKVLAGVDGVVEPRVDSEDEEPTVEVQVDLAAAQRYGIKPGDVRRAAATLLSGVGVGSLFQEQKVFDVVVWGTPQIRHSVTGIRELLVDRPGGGQVRLGDVAEVRIVPNPNVIERDAVSRFVDVAASVRGRDLDAVAGNVERRLQGLEFPLEYHAEVLGDTAARRAAGQRSLGYAVAAAIGAFLLLQAAFGSWRLASVIVLTLPMALAGGALAAFAAVGTLSLPGLVGFFTVLGIAVRNSITLVKHYQRLELQEGETFGPGLVLRGSRERLAPVLMTALGTGLALVPSVILGNVPGLEVVRPVAIVVLGGLVTSTVFTLFVVPSLYLRFASSPEPDTVARDLAPIPRQPYRDTQPAMLRGELDATR